MEKPKSNVSFTFSKVKINKVVDKRPTYDDASLQEVDRDLITAVEGKRLKSTKPTEDKHQQLVIPLIGSNNWRIPPKNAKYTDQVSNGSQNTTDGSEKWDSSIEDEAVKQIVAEAARQRDRWENRDQEDPESVGAPRVVPLMVQNQVPEGFETDDKLDVSLRPDEPVETVYESIPISQFGAAMLRGMGWKDETKTKETAGPLGPVARPKGLGLGADRSRTEQAKYQPAGGKTEEAAELVMKKGAYCVVTGGQMKDLYGEVEGIDEDNCRVIVHMTLSGDTVNLSQFAVQLVAKDDYKKYSKYLNKGKSDKYKSEQLSKRENGETRDTKEHREKRRDRDATRSPDTSDSGTKRKHGKSERSSQKSQRGESKHEPTSKRTKASPQPRSCDLWLRPFLRVRIVDRKHSLYKQKVIIEDVVTGDSCICRTEEGRVLEDLRQRHLETVIPRSDHSYVMIVSGKHKNKLAEVLSRDKENCEATVQLLSDRDTVILKQYDALCEYTGDVSMEMDY